MFENVWANWGNNNTVKVLLFLVTHGCVPQNEVMTEDGATYLGGANFAHWSPLFNDATWVVARLDEVFKSGRCKRREWNSLRIVVLNGQKKRV